jgi:co-chaperonin GroES (HSP10)
MLNNKKKKKMETKDKVEIAELVSPGPGKIICVEFVQDKTESGLYLPPSERKKKGKMDDVIPMGDKRYSTIVAIGMLPDDYKLKLAVGDKIISTSPGRLLEIQGEEYELINVHQVDAKLNN